MNQKRLLSSLLVAMLMMALSPAKMLADAVFTITLSSDSDIPTLKGKFGDAYGYDNVTFGNYVDKNTPITVTVTGSVTEVGYRMFEQISNLTSITIPEGVTKIDGYAFFACYGLKSVSLPSTVTTIGEYAFSNCKSLESITIPSGVTSISNNTFEYCSSLTSIDIPEGVTTIGRDAFRACSCVSSISIPSTVESIASFAFDGCYVENTKMDNKSTKDPVQDGDLTIVDTEQEDGLLIKDNSVVKCRQNATSVTIPSSVTSLADNSFRMCEKLKTITCESKTPASLGTNVFYGTVEHLQQVLVPASSVNAYKEAWSDLASLIQAIPAVTLTFDENADEVPAYDHNKTYDIVTINRTIKANVWNTLYLPIDMTADEVVENFGSDVQLKVYSGMEDNVVNFVDATAVEHTKIYIVKPTKAITSITVSDKKVSIDNVPTSAQAYTIYGRYYKLDVTSEMAAEMAQSGMEDIYVLSNNKFYKIDSAITIKGFRWYVCLANSSMTAKQLSLRIEGESEETSIDAIADFAPAQNGKCLENGKLVIVKNGVKYNVMGIRN